MAVPDLCQYSPPEPPGRYQPNGTCHSSATEDAAALCVPYLMQFSLGRKSSSSAVHQCSSARKESACKAGDRFLIPGSGSSPGEGIGYPLQYSWASPAAQVVKNLPAIWETWLRSLGWEDPLEMEMTTHSNMLAWRIPWTEEPGGLQSMELQRVGHD